MGNTDFDLSDSALRTRQMLVQHLIHGTCSINGTPATGSVSRIAPSTNVHLCLCQDVCVCACVSVCVYTCVYKRELCVGWE